MTSTTHRDETETRFARFLQTITSIDDKMRARAIAAIDPVVGHLVAIQYSNSVRAAIQQFRTEAQR